jgi:ribosome biogenesis protein Nip4
MGDVFKKLLEEEGIAEPLDEILKYMKVSMSYAFRHYEEKYHIDNTFIERFNEQRLEVEFHLCKLFAGIEEICRYIHTSGRKNYLYTHRGESAIKLLKSSGL